MFGISFSNENINTICKLEEEKNDFRSLLATAQYTIKESKKYTIDNIIDLIFSYSPCRFIV